MTKLKDEINSKIGVEVFDLVNDIIRFKSNVTGKLVKKYLLDDLVIFFNGKPQMTLRLQDMIIEISQGQVVVVRDCVFY